MIRMTEILRRSFAGIKEIISFLSKPHVKNMFIFIVSTFILLNSLSAYAVEIQLPEHQFDVKESYKQAGGICDIGAEVKEGTANSFSGGCETNLGIPLGIMTTLVPQSVTGFTAEVINDPDVSPLYKYGIIEQMDNNIVALVDSQPTVNVADHIAMEWVPGYDSINNPNSNSVYAADGYSYLVDLGLVRLWNFFRNIAYVLFVVMLIATGFMIMFRQKIGGQIAITVFNSLPNVVIGLVLVTFSFFIVGVMLNFSALLTKLSVAILGLDDTNSLYVVNILDLAIFKILFGKTYEARLSELGLSASPIVDFVAGFMFVAAGAGLLALGSKLHISVPFIILLLAIVLIFVIASVRVWLTLFKAFLGIVINTVTAPLQITFGVLPGQSGLQIKWFFSILKGALTFPLVFFLINLPTFFLVNDITFDASGIIRGDFEKTPSATLPIIGEVPGGISGWLMNGVIKIALPVVVYYFAADAPKILDEYFPTEGSKGVLTAIESTKKSLQKFPIVGSFIS